MWQDIVRDLKTSLYPDCMLSFCIGKWAKVLICDSRDCHKRNQSGSYHSTGALNELALDGSTISTRSYDAGRRQTTEVLGNGITETRSYRSDNLLSGISYSNTSLGDLSYTWDANKNKTSESITGVMSGYGFTSGGTTYDFEDRLTGYARASGTFNQSWNLTSVGDWTSVTTNGIAQNRTHGPTHELLTAGGSSVVTDVKGNMTSIPATLRPAGATTALLLSWDFDNKLASADIDANGTADVSFQYDALGRRVARTGTGGSFVFVQMDQQTIADYPVGGAASTPTYRYVYASYIDEPVVRKTAGTGGTLVYFHRNQQFSITAITTSSGTATERYAYSPYGLPTILDASGTSLSSSAISNRYTYTGRELDSTLGLHHFRARWMSGLTGRFLSRDPIGFKGKSLGLYQYARARTLRYVDPSGLIQIAPDGDPKVMPPYTNCIGYCVHPTEDFVIPSSTIKNMLDFFKLECNSKAGSGEDCLAKCRENLAAGGQGCSQLVIYILDISPDVTRRVREVLEELRNARNQRDYEFLLNELWNVMAENLGDRGGSGEDPIDIHMSKCNPKFPYEYEMQMGMCKKGSPKDRTDYFFPTPADPEVISLGRILFKTCCCKGAPNAQNAPNSLPMR